MSLFGSAPQAQTQTVASGVDIQSSVYGGVVPVLYGRTRCTGNLIWYGDFQAIPVKSQASGGKGGDSNSGADSYNYKTSFIFALPEGTLTDLQTVYASKSATAFADSHLSFATGDPTQAPWGYLTTKYPGQDLAYAGTGYVYAMAYDLGSSAQLPNLSYEVTGLFPDTIPALPDADPAAVVKDILTNPRYGTGFPLARINTAGFDIFSNYCRALNLVVSPLFDTQQDAAGQVNQIVQSCNSEFVWSGAQLTIVPYGDEDAAANGASYTAPAAPLYSLTDDDFLYAEGEDPVQCARKRPSDQMNSIKLEWLNRQNQYATEIIEAKDQAAIEAYGLRADQPAQAHWFCDLVPATMAATLRLQRQAIRNVYSFTLGWRYCLLDPMDIVEITDANLGLVDQWVRILTIDENENGDLAITAEEYLGGTGAAPLYDYESGSPFIPNFNIAPGPVNAPLIFEPSPLMLAARSITAPQIMIGASGGPNWGGCEVWLSLDDTTYKRMGRITAPARQGFLTNTLAAGSDPDTSHTVSVALGESKGALLSGTQADADAFRTLCYVDGELIAYETADLTGANSYGLTYLRRGVYGTGIEAHANGTAFCRLDDAVASFDLPVTPVSYVGQTLYLKFLSFNVYGGAQQQLADVSPYVYDPNGQAVYVAPPGSPSFTVGAEQQKDGTWISYGVVSWTASPDPLFDQYEVQYRLHAGPGPWIGWRGGKDTTSFRISPLPANTAYDVQVRAVRTSGPFYSAWAQNLNTTTVGKTTPPPPPTSPSCSGGYRQITLDWVASAENDIAFYEIWESGDSVLAHASRIGIVNATHYLRPGLNLSDTRWYWLRAQDTSGNFSTYLGPVSATTLGVDSADLIGQIVGAQIAANTLEASHLISGLDVVQSVPTISAADHAVSLVAYAADTKKLYRWDGASWTSAIDSVDVSAGSIDITKFASGITPVQIVASLPGTATEGQVALLTSDGQTYRYHSGAWTVAVPAVNVTGTLTDAQIAALAASKITGQLTDGQIADLSAAKLTGQITTAQIAEGAISTPKLAAGAVTTANLAAGAITASKLTIGDATNLIVDPQFQDQTYWTLFGNSVSGAIYYQVGFPYTPDLGSPEIVVVNTGITGGTVGQYGVYAPFVAVTPNQSYNASVDIQAIGAVPAVGCLIYVAVYGADKTTVLQAFAASANPVGGVQHVNVTFTPPAGGVYARVHVFSQTNSIVASSGYWCWANVALIRQATATTIANGAITTDKVAANAVTAGKIAANTITAAQIQAGAITATELAASAVTAGKIAANAVTAGTVAAGAITAGTIAAGAISATELAASAVTAGKIAAGAVTAGTVAAGAITANEISSGAITANKIAAGTITAAQISAAGITGDRIAANTLTATNFAANSVTAAAILAGTITGDKINGNFFQGYSFTASSAGSSYVQMFGGNFTSGGLSYGPYFASVDGTGAVRAVVGLWEGQHGLHVWNSSGVRILDAGDLGVNIVGTTNIIGNSVTYPVGVSVLSGTPIIWGGTAAVDGTMLISASLSVSNISGSPGGVLRIRQNGTDIRFINFTCGPYQTTVSIAFAFNVTAGDAISVRATENVADTIDWHGGSMFSLTVRR